MSLTLERQQGFIEKKENRHLMLQELYSFKWIMKLLTFGAVV